MPPASCVWLWKHIYTQRLVGALTCSVSVRSAPFPIRLMILTPDFQTSITHTSRVGETPGGSGLRCKTRLNYIWRPEILCFLQAPRWCWGSWSECLSVTARVWPPEPCHSGCLIGLVFIGALAHYSLMQWLANGPWRQVPWLKSQPSCWLTGKTVPTPLGCCGGLSKAR